MSSAPRGLAPREGLELVMMKMGHAGPPIEPHRRQASLGTPVPRTPTVCKGRTIAIVLPASMVKAPQWRKPKTDCHNKRKLASDPMTVLNYKINGGHPVLSDGPFITLAEVLTA